jgi:hypothetical protein
VLRAFKGNPHATSASAHCSDGLRLNASKPGPDFAAAKMQQERFSDTFMGVPVPAVCNITRLLWVNPQGILNVALPLELMTGMDALGGWGSNECKWLCLRCSIKSGTRLTLACE